MRSQRISSKFYRFVVVGAVATGIQYVVLIIGVYGLKMNSTLASSVGFVLSAIVNYILNYRYTFSSTAPHLLAVKRFVLVASFGLFINAALMWLLTEHLAWPVIIAQTIATVCVLLWNFCGHAFWSFKVSRAAGL